MLNGYLPNFLIQLRGFFNICLRVLSFEGFTTGDIPAVLLYFVDTMGAASPSFLD